jgi:hypothetical protein
MLVFVICKCHQYNLLTKSKKELQEELEDTGSFGLVESDNPDFQYMRRSNCGVCGSTVYMNTDYAKKNIYNWACRQIADKLRAKV